ncbi:hypothetical protein [Bacillus sp. HNA3]|uniref:beta-xylosidase family glycoside hydrolase n=1 Tax=Bacillus sp. HNA3 TaxID=2585772 RepID=UPI0024951F43|nr:hypothetical protein [Bacillus sp. HNA3]
MYSFNKEDWHKIDMHWNRKNYQMITSGGGFFTGAFVGMQCQDTSGHHISADFRYFRYKENN